jgi:hypothetical protein
VDPLGHADFEWRGAEFKNGGRPNSGGVTMWWKFAPEAEVYCLWSGCCCGVRLSGGEAGTFGIINDGSKYGENIAEHEWYHVDHHFKPAFDDYKSAAASLGATCKSKGLAMCLKGVIEGELAAEYRAQAIRVGVQYDWDDYARDKGDPETKAERQEALKEAIRRYELAKAATKAAIAACLARKK